MQIGWLDVENSRVARRRSSSRLLYDERERVGFIEQTKLALWILRVGWIGEQSTAKKIPMEISDEGSHVPDVHRGTLPVKAAVTTHQGADVFRPETFVRVVHRQI